MDALVVEAVPTAAQRSFAEMLPIQSTAVDGSIVLARHIEHAIHLRTLDHLFRSVKLSRLRYVAHVAGVQDQIGLLFRLRNVNLVDGGLQCRGDVRVGRLAEADVAIADLEETKRAGVRRAGRSGKETGCRHPTDESP